MKAELSFFFVLKYVFNKNNLNESCAREYREYQVERVILAAVIGKYTFKGLLI